VKTRLPTRIACEYGPMAAGAEGVAMTVLLMVKILASYVEKTGDPGACWKSPDER